MAIPQASNVQGEQTKMGGELISIVVPVFDNAPTLAPLTERVCQAMATAGKSVELVFVDDCSADASWETIASLARSDSICIRGFRLPRNAGQHTAVLLGLRHASGAWCVVLDADLQDSPELIPALLAARTDGIDVVFGGRQGRYQDFGRSVTGRFSRALLSMLVGVPRDAGMFFVLRRTQVEQMLDLRVSAVMIIAMIGLSGSRSSTVPVARAVRTVGRSGYGWGGRLHVGLQMCRSVMEKRLGFRRTPIRTRIDALSRECVQVASVLTVAADRD